MARLLLALVLGLLGAVVVHIAVIFTVPDVARNNAWGRLSRVGAMYEVVRVEPLRSQSDSPAAQPAGSRLQNFAFVDPAFITASCRFSLADGPVRIYAGQPTDFWSGSIYSRQGDNLYSINDRASVDGAFDLLVGTHDEIVDARASALESQSETSIPVEIETLEGYLTVRALVAQESLRPSVEAFLRSIRCEPSAPPAAALTGARAG
ncbi:hypothetical protein [Aurantimonas sp. Leaf443]|uniref:DUF1254 domain-containing protein n=1 Tax=Aurantimonas sp. Leaf443 TaxID=1736378 RepID=UPI0006FFA32F|nr:hypothetical protein [Aurantimonas sp. Leaf443]KQT88222.1 hypothetical protein ASG48_01950 [Aurantimonas sp. Leaf443]